MKVSIQLKPQTKVEDLLRQQRSVTNVDYNRLMTCTVGVDSVQELIGAGRVLLQGWRLLLHDRLPKAVRHQVRQLSPVRGGRGRQRPRQHVPPEVLHLRQVQVNIKRENTHFYIISLASFVIHQFSNQLLCEDKHFETVSVFA